MVGCSTPSNPYFSASPPAAPETPPWPAPAPTPETVLLQDPTPAVIAHDIEESLTLPVTNAPPVAAVQPSRWGTGWIPLQTWAAAAGLSNPQRSVQGNVSKYSVATRTGICTITMGSRRAVWNGTEVWLGYAPRFVRGQPHLHAIDAERTLLPLAQPFTVVNHPDRTVVIDPGHGGLDSGTRGARGEREKDFTLDWALKLEQRLTNAGWNVVLTRRTDIDVPLPARILVADRARADLFVSLHFNSAHPSTAPSGIETYCLTPSGAPSTLLRGYADDPRASFANNAFDPANIQYAYQIHRELLEATHANDNGLKHARFMGVLRYQQRPALLIEGGFLSNPAEIAKIRSEAYRETLAEAVFRALNQ